MRQKSDTRLSLIDLTYEVQWRERRVVARIQINQSRIDRAQQLNILFACESEIDSN